MGAQPQSDEPPGPPASNAEVHGAANEKRVKKKKRGFSRFISVLNCCSATESADSVDTDGPLVPAKVAASPPGAGRLSIGEKQGAVANNKPDANAPDSSVTDSKEPLDELARETEKTEMGADTQQAEAVEHVAAPERTEAERRADESVPEAREEVSRDDRLPEDSLPPLHEAAIVPEQAMDGQGTSPTSDVKVVVQAPTPVVPPPDQVPSPVEQPVEQPELPLAGADKDVEMTDAPPPASDDVAKESIPEEITPKTDELPPPPPPPTTADSSLSSQPRSSFRESPLGSVPGGEQQQWLLPPLQSHFRGRKCLVLDLDETLVHSSFKVRVYMYSFLERLLISLSDFTSGRLYHTCRD